MAESTSQTTTDLAGHAQGPALGLWDVNRFHFDRARFFGGGKADQPFPRAVFRHLTINDFWDSQLRKLACDSC